MCSQNQWRSPTAEALFDRHPHYQARSAGTEAGARVRVTAGLLGWAEAVFVMERRHAERLREKFGAALAGKPLLVLRIPDKYQLGDPRLVALLQARLAPYLPLLEPLAYPLPYPPPDAKTPTLFPRWPAALRIPNPGPGLRAGPARAQQRRHLAGRD